MPGQLILLGMPHSKKQMSTSRLFCLGVVILLCIFMGYQLAPYGHSKFIPNESRGPQSVASILPQHSEDLFKGFVQPEAFVKPVQPVNGVESSKEANHDFDFCTNNCNNSNIYKNLWYGTPIRANSYDFQPSKDPNNSSQELIETNLITKDFRLVIKVLAFNRVESLARCLQSLALADYRGDNVNIQIFIDHFRYKEIRRNESHDHSDIALEGVGKVSNSKRYEPFSKPTKVKGRGRRLLRDLFKEAPIHEMDMQANSTTTGKLANGPNFGHKGFILEGGHEIVGKLSKDFKKKMGLQEWDSTIEVPLGAYDGQGFLNDDITRETESLNAQLREAHEILKYVDEFQWNHGTKEIHYRSQNVGLQQQWIEAWWPTDLDEFAFIVEDDMEVSNLYYRFLHSVIATYYYNPQEYNPSIYGISLQRPRFVPGIGGLPLKVKSTKNLFLYPLVGTWGQLLFPKQWKEFRLWYDDHKSQGERPILEGMVTNSWYKKLGERIWTPWFVKFVHARGYFNLYTNFFDERALSISHRKPGSNYKKAGGPDSQLLNTTEAGNDTMLWVMSPSKSLPLFDFCFRGVKIWKLAQTSTELIPMLASMERNNSILLVNIIDVHSILVRNWLCHMERLGMRKFLLLGDDDELLSNFARRGYATVSSQLYTKTETASTHLRRDMIAVQAVHEILKLGYNVWLTRADTMWVENPIDIRIDISDVMGSQPLDAFHPALLYINQRMLHVWSRWIGNMSDIARDLRNNNTIKHSSIWPGLQSFITSSKNCHYSALPSNLSGSFRDLKTIKPIKKVILFNGTQGRNVPLVVNTLKAAGLWVIDKDLACKRVYC